MTNNENEVSASVGCVTIVILCCALANMWLTWRICRAVEAILAK